MSPAKTEEVCFHLQKSGTFPKLSVSGLRHKSGYMWPLSRPTTGVNPIGTEEHGGISTNQHQDRLLAVLE